MKIMSVTHLITYMGHCKSLSISNIQFVQVVSIGHKLGSYIDKSKSTVHRLIKNEICKMTGVSHTAIHIMTVWGLKYIPTSAFLFELETTPAKCYMELLLHVMFFSYPQSLLIISS